jgi:hypothetical protein
VLEAANANIGGRLSSSRMRALQEALGCPLRLVNCHY